MFRIAFICTAGFVQNKFSLRTLPKGPTTVVYLGSEALTLRLTGGRSSNITHICMKILLFPLCLFPLSFGWLEVIEGPAAFSTSYLFIFSAAVGTCICMHVQLRVTQFDSHMHFNSSCFSWRSPIVCVKVCESKQRWDYKKASHACVGVKCVVWQRP